jgi:subtilisin family serine protease
VKPLHVLVVVVASALGMGLTPAGAGDPQRTLAAVTVEAGDRGAVVTPASTLLKIDDPLAPAQWYLQRTHVFDGWTEWPPLEPVKVAIIDSGIDVGHPEFLGRIFAAKSFVDGPVRDTQGHGTIVAGIVGAGTDNAIGIAGLAPSAELLIAKVVGSDRSISVRAEAKAIRWAVDQGARVINMSLGGLRDPRNPNRDDYSSLEAEAIRYAVSKGVLVVAAVGNSDQAPREPWPFATYPAALPHVLGVSSIGRSGAVPSFSNRDQIYNDVAAPGVAILSTFPRTLTAGRESCLEQGYTVCATEEFVDPEGTSFSAPQVTAVAANLLALNPELRAEQVAAIVQRSATDAGPATGCGACAPGRDALSGWGELDGASAVAALAEPLPPTDLLEPNDDSGTQAARLYFAPGSQTRGVRATVDFWDDRDDVYAVRLQRGDRLFSSLKATGADTAFALWLPGTQSVDDLSRQDRRLRLSRSTGPDERFAYTAAQGGWYFIQVRITEPGGPISYRLSVVRKDG